MNNFDKTLKRESFAFREEHLPARIRLGAHVCEFSAHLPRFHRHDALHSRRIYKKAPRVRWHTDTLLFSVHSYQYKRQYVFYIVDENSHAADPRAPRDFAGVLSKWRYSRGLIERLEKAKSAESKPYSWLAARFKPESRR